MTRLLRFPRAVKRDPAIDAWMDARSDVLGLLARRWFTVMRGVDRTLLTAPRHFAVAA